ncbi:hypothetical protein HYQ46_009826 [Verticillium longisporum]|nr:hypothetical protein HYQ46_009826 [Verticillium longisporum]
MDSKPSPPRTCCWSRPATAVAAPRARAEVDSLIVKMHNRFGFGAIFPGCCSGAWMPGRATYLTYLTLLTLGDGQLSAGLCAAFCLT